MGRKLEFNLNHAIQRATRVFWAKGYTGASMRDLLKAMGIGEGSFYHLFPGKKRLYLECLKQYSTSVMERRIAALTAESSVRKGIRAFFHALLDELDDPRTPRVCLLSQSLSSEVMEEPDLEPYISAQMKSFEALFIERLELAKKSGELPRTFASQLTSEIILTWLQGFFRVVQVLKNRKQMWCQIEALLKSLGL